MPKISISQIDNNLEILGNYQNERARLERIIDQAVLKIHKKYADQLQKLDDQIHTLFATIAKWAQQNQAVVCSSKTKTAQLTNGQLAWRTKPKRLVVHDEESAVNFLKGIANAKALLRHTISLNKTAILAHPEMIRHVEGLEIQEGEEYLSIKPANSGITLKE